MRKLLLGIDAGTTAFKAALFDEKMNALAAAQQDYQLQSREGNRVEFPAEEYFRVLCRCVRQLVEKIPSAAGEVCALALSCQGETLVCLDADGQPLGDAIVWLDGRAEAEADALRQRFGRRAVYEITGQSDMTATWPAAKLLWLRSHARERFARSRRFLLLEDYLLFRLTGQFVGEKNLWASSAMMNIHTGKWWAEMLAELGIDAKALPELAGSAAPIATLTPEAARATGLNPSVLVAAGALDQTCNLIGCGITRPGSVCESTGSCLAVSAVLDSPIPYDERRPVTCQNHAVPGRYTLLSWSQSAGMALKWCARELYRDAASLEEAYARINQEAENIPIGSDGIVALPYFAGTAFPEFDGNARAVFFGANLSHTRGHFAHAVMESVACMLRQNLNLLNAARIPVDRVFCMGGGANSPVWLQIKADIAQTRMVRLRATDSACRGAAALAGVAVGMFPSIDALPNAEISGAVYEPRPTPQAGLVLQRYEELYAVLKPFFQKCASQNKEVVS